MLVARLVASTPAPPKPRFIISILFIDNLVTMIIQSCVPFLQLAQLFDTSVGITGDNF